MPEGVSWSHFLRIWEFSEFRYQCFVIALHHWPTKFLIIFLEIIIQTDPDDVKFALVLHCLYWCYTWTALLSANRAIFRVYYRCPRSQNYTAPFQNLSLSFILKIFIKFRKFQPRYSYKIYSCKKKNV